jgi:hypothetical protein
MMMERWDPAGGEALVNQAAVAGDSCVVYFLAMLWYHRNPADPKALVVLHGINGGPSQVDSRWENHGLPPLRHSVLWDLEVIAYRLWLPDRGIDPPGLLVDDTHVCTWAECRRYGDETFIIRYCSAGCRISHEYDL